MNNPNKVHRDMFLYIDDNHMPVIFYIYHRI
jgi:hypothetical protein